MVEDNVLSEEEAVALEQEVQRRVDESVEFGKNSPLPSVEEVTDHVYA
jgi:pyruvate dehydrogenase E1 component alpha subunit